MPLHKPHGKKSQVYQVQPGKIFEVIHEHSELLGPDAKHEVLIDTYLRGPKSRVRSSNLRILNNFRKGPLHETPNQAQDEEFRA